MKTIGQYREDIKALVKKSGDIEAKATNENRDLTAEELSLMKEINSRIDELNDMVATLDHRQLITTGLDAPAAPPVTRPGPSARAPERTDRERFSSFGQ